MLSIIHESFNVIPITRNCILQLHKILYTHTNNPIAGQTKNVQNYISATYPDGHTEILFTPLASYETPPALDRICEEYSRVIGNMELEPLIAIPVFYPRFPVHPSLQRRERTHEPSSHDAPSQNERFCGTFFVRKSDNCG